MPIKKHVEYKDEKKRLDETKIQLENTIHTVLENREKYKEDIKEAYIQLDYLDSSHSYSTIMLNSTLLEDLEKNFDLLIHSRKKPYFARMDIKQKNKKKTEQFYIGKVSLMEEGQEVPWVVDWRAPIASVYYEGRLGDASYKVNGLEHSIELLKKRQYMIENGNLENFMDVDISTTDTFLQASLENHAGKKLKDIVSTIQGEQNRIIRADIAKPLIVQGVAGSGKTTIALHRIAYLIYTYSDTFLPDEFMIIAPNNLFLDYISGVLPELGADKVKQTTYTDLMFKVIGEKYKLTDSNRKLNEIIRTDKKAPSEEEKSLIIRSASFKNSIKMKDLLDVFIKEIEDKVLPGRPYSVEGYNLISSEGISEFYYKDYGYQPVFKRLDNIKKYLAKYTRNAVPGLLERITVDYGDKIDQVKKAEEDTEERRFKTIALMEERKKKLHNVSKNSRTAVGAYMNKFYSGKLIDLYMEFLEKIEKHKDLAEEDEEVLRYMKRESLLILNSKQFEIEDLAALAYLKEKLFGIDSNFITKNVFIDEAQDFGNFQFYVLRRILKTDSFTILGDLSQGIYSFRAIKDWEYLKNNIFDSEVNYLTLEQSYRTTIEIMNLANKVLEKSPSKHLITAKPVVRHGEEPKVIGFKDKKLMHKNIFNQTISWMKEGYTTIAIITKTFQEGERIYKEVKEFDLGNKLDMVLIEEKTEHFNHRISVIPAHLAKGLEFDCAMIVSEKEKFAETDLDIKLFYVAATRAMHRLAVFSLEG